MKKTTYLGSAILGLVGVVMIILLGKEGDLAQKEEPLLGSDVQEIPHQGVWRGETSTWQTSGERGSIDIQKAFQSEEVKERIEAVYPEHASHGSERFAAEVGVLRGKELHTGRPDSSGYFPQVYVQPNEVVDVAVWLPDLSAGGTVWVYGVDGGFVREVGKMGKVEKPYLELRADANGQIRFPFEVSQYSGVHRVVVKYQNTEEQVKEYIVDLWAGEPLPLARK